MTDKALQSFAAMDHNALDEIDDETLVVAAAAARRRRDG